MLRRALGVLVALLLASRLTHAEGREQWLQGALDHVDRHHTVLLYTDEAGRQYLRQLDLDALGIHVSARPDHRHAAEWYYRLDEILGYGIHVDETCGFVFMNTASRTEIPKPPTNELLLDAIVNTEHLADPVPLHYRNGELWLPAEAQNALRIDAAKVRDLETDGELSMHAIAGEYFAVDYQNLVLYGSISPELLQESRLTARTVPIVAASPPTHPGAIFSYDIADGRDTAQKSWKSGLFELAFVSERSTCSSDEIALPYVNDFRRLDTQCTIDRVSRRESLTIGDTISQADLLGAPVRFGGFRIGTDFGVDPYYVPQPTYSVAGSARVPSTLEVSVNQMLTYTQAVPPGPFSVGNIPVPTGAGEIRAVINDGTGTQQVLSQAYYSDAALLKAGTWAWTLDAGKLRENYALPGDRYTNPFANLDVHYGVSDWLTITPHAEGSNQFGRLAFGGVARLGDFGVLQLSGSASTSDGHLGTGLIERLSRRAGIFSFSLSHETTDNAYVELGYPTRGSAPAQISQANFGLSLPAGILLSVGGSRSVMRDTGSLRLLTASMSIPVGRFGSILVTALDPLEPAGPRLYTASFVAALGERTTASASAFHEGSTSGETVQVQQNAPLGPGYGYRLLASQGQGGYLPDQEAEGIARWSAAALRIDVDETDHAFSDQVELSGAVLLSKAGLELGRRQDGATATVQLQWPGVRIYMDDQLAAVTDAAGAAVVRGLRPYQINRLRLEIDDLPIDAEVENPELSLVPGRREIVAADFKVRKTHHITGHLVSRVGRIPPGATVKIIESGAEFPLGYDGLLYLEIDAVQAVTLQVDWPQGHCKAVLRSFTTDDAAVDAGDIPCQ
jgi:outer membrane usher protein